MLASMHADRKLLHACAALANEGEELISTSTSVCQAQCQLRRHTSGPKQVLEQLYRLKWGRLDGLGALIISPTRELALQIFDELRKVGGRHTLSAGVLIGGKSVRQEAERVNGEAPDLAGS